MQLKQAVPYVVAAYMGIWVVLFVYMFIVNNRLSRLKKELSVLSKAFEKKGE